MAPPATEPKGLSAYLGMYNWYKKTPEHRAIRNAKWLKYDPDGDGLELNEVCARLADEVRVSRPGRAGARLFNHYKLAITYAFHDAKDAHQTGGEEAKDSDGTVKDSLIGQPKDRAMRDQVVSKVEFRLLVCYMRF